MVLALLKGILEAIFGAKNLKYIPRIIVKLAEEPSVVGSSFKELKFAQVLAYAQENGAITKQTSDYFEFIVNIEAQAYSVYITKTFDGSNRAIFRSKLTDDDSIGSCDSSDSSLASDPIDLLENAYEKHERKSTW